jgi:hypothetical protein
MELSVCESDRNEKLRANLKMRNELEGQKAIAMRRCRPTVTVSNVRPERTMRPRLRIHIGRDNGSVLRS